MSRRAKPKVRQWTQTLSHNFFSPGITKVVYPLLWRLPTRKVYLSTTTCPAGYLVK